jgi:2-C-methyl-D-erythritol 4-phosphate cytidylyltransferase
MTVGRSHLFRAETPQVFRRAVLEEALQQCANDGFIGTDEASIVERLQGVSILAVAASRPNPKLTQPQDLPLVEMLLQQKGGA